MTNSDQIAKLQRCIALLEEADTLQQQALGDSDQCYDNHNRIQDLIDDLSAAVQEDEHDGQPDEAQEWYDFNPDC